MRSQGTLVVAVLLALAATAVVAPRGRAQEEAPAGTAPSAPPETGGVQPSVPAIAGSLGNAWTITPSISAAETFDDNINSTPKQREADLATTLTPGIYINGDTPRLAASFNYDPQFIVHAQATYDDQVTQNLLGTGTLTAVPDLLFVNAQASIQNLDRLGGLGYGNQAEIPTSQTTQTTVYSLSPYMQFHFGDTGDSELRYQVAQSIFTGNTGAITSPTTGTTLGPISNAITQEGTASFTTGEAFARLQLSAVAEDLQENDSDGATSQNASGSLGGTYQISGPYFATGEVGYERLTFSPTNSGNYSGLTWSVGGRFAPRDDRIVSLSYGESEGETGFTGNAVYGLTPLTTLTASYSESTETEQAQLLQGLSGLTIAAPGSTSIANGVPVSPVAAGQQNIGGAVNPVTGVLAGLQNPNLALQNAVERVNSLVVSVVMEGTERNNYSLSFDRAQTEALSAGGTSQTSDGGIVTWNRDMTPSMTSTVSAGYSVTASSTPMVVTTTVSALTLNAGLNYAVSNTLSASANYSLSRQQGGTTGTILVDLVTVSLTKQF